MKRNLMPFCLLLAGAAFARESVFFIGAHPDDFEAAVGLALCLKSDYDVHIIDFTRGEGGCGDAGFRDGTTARKRMAEEREVAKAFGTEPTFLSQVNYQGRYAYANEKVTREIEELVLKLRPKAVFTHWPVDEHPDHVQCAAAVRHALWNVKRDCGFVTEEYFFEEAPWQTMNYRPTYYVDVTSKIGAITNLIGKYECQDGKAIAQGKLKQMQERGRNAPTPVGYAETYATVSGQKIPGGLLDRYSVR